MRDRGEEVNSWAQISAILKKRQAKYGKDDEGQEGMKVQMNRDREKDETEEEEEAGDGGGA